MKGERVGLQHLPTLMARIFKKLDHSAGHEPLLPLLSFRVGLLVWMGLMLGLLKPSERVGRVGGVDL